MNRDVQEAHLTILGWRPAKFKPYRHYKGWIYGMVSARQWCGELYGKTQVQYLQESAIIKDLEWWVITDDVLRRITETVDASVAGWGDGD